MTPPTYPGFARSWFGRAVITRRPAARRWLGEFAGQPLEDRVVPTFGATGHLSPTAAGAEPVAAVEAGPRLAAVDTADSALLSGLLSALAGPNANVSLTAVDYEALSNGAVNLGGLLGHLQATLGAGSPAAALTADATLGQVLDAAAAAAQADGDTTVATILGGLSAVRTAPGTLRLGDLLNIGLPAGSFAQAEVNALDLLVGGVQQLNYQNLATTATPVALTAPALGPLGPAVQGVTLQARVVEPPVFVVGPAGSQFHSAAVRLKIDVDLADLALDTNSLTAPIQAALGGAATVSAAATVGRLSLFADVARGSGTIQAIDALTNAVTLRSTPAVADVYLGTVPDGVFFDRTRPLDPAADLAPGVVGTFDVSAILGGFPVLDLSLGLTARSGRRGAAVTPYVTTYLPAFPKADTVGGKRAAVVGDLVATLVQNLQIGVDGDLGLLAGQSAPILAALSGAGATGLRPALHNLLGGLLDPALGGLGIGLGQMDLVVLGADSPDAPAATDDTASTTRDQPVTVAVQSNDAVQAGTTPALTVTTAPQHGTAVANPDGTVTYTPAAGYLGADSFGYTLTDTYGRASSAKVQVQVNRGANALPVAGSDSATTTRDRSVTVSVLANDSDADGDLLSVSAVTQPAHGSAAVNPDGTVTYTPAAGYVGPDSFSYTVDDGFGGTATGSVSVQVGRGSNQSPVASPDSPTTGVGAAVTVAVLANDSDPDGDALSVTALTQPAHGSAVLNPDGTVTYTPAAGFRGTDTFTYTLADGFGGSATGTVSVGVSGNTPPVVRPESVSTTAGSAVTVAVLANDSDPDGDPLGVTVTTPPAHGTAVVNADGTVTYTPAPGYVGQDSFTYAATDGFGGSGTAVVSVTVGRGANQLPVVTPDSASTPVGTAVVVPALANDSDADGDALTVTAVTQPAHGTVTANADGTLTYTPAPGFRGTDSFTYTAGDGFGGSGTAAVSVVVGSAAGNAPPVARPDTLATTAGLAATLDVRTNDSDADGDPLSVQVASPPAHGTVVVNADGTVTYTPATGFVGADSFGYTVTDGFGGSASATVAVQVSRGPNGSPTVGADTASTPFSKSVTVAVLANDSDPDGDRLTVTGVSTPASGSAEVNPDGTVTYRPLHGFSGTDTFTYTVSDGQGGSAAGTVTVTVARYRPPVARPDSAAVTAGAAVAVDVLANDSDADGGRLTLAGFGQPAHGTVTANADGTLTYTPAPGFVGEDIFDYAAVDGAGETATSTVSVTVRPAPNTGPSVNPDAPTTPVGTAVTVAVLANDSDPDGDRLSVSAVTQPGHGTVTVNADGTLTYTPAAGFRGVDAFTYTAADGRGGAGSATVSVTVEPSATVPPTVPPTSPPATPPTVPPASPAPSGGDTRRPFAVGADTTGGPRVTVFNADGTPRFDFFAYDPDARFGVSVALADVTGDGVLDVVTGPGVGGGPHVRVFDGVNLAVVFDFFAFEPDFRGGVWVAAGDYDGDGRADVIVGAGAGGSPRVRVYGGRDGSPLADFHAFDPADRGGVQVAAADLDADGLADVMASNGRGAVAGVRVFAAADGSVLQDDRPFEAGYTDASVAAADLTGDGTPDVVVGAGVGGGPRVQVFDGVTGQVVADRFVYEESFTGGVRVATADLDGDGRPEILTGAGVGGGPRQQVWTGTGDMPVVDRMVFEEEFRGGLYLA